MSVINGIWQKDGPALEKERLLQQAAFNSKYAPDGTNVRLIGSVGMSFQGFHSHERSSFQPGPLSDPFGNLAVLDGRIDNGEELGQVLDCSYEETGDTALVLAAFRRWGKGCFNRLVGDWAVALWDGNEHSLYLARDHAGTRTLYYSQDRNSVEWSTYPEPLASSSSDLKLCNEYAVRYLACLPLDDLTPYDRIRTVQAGHFLQFSSSSPVRKIRHWKPVLRECSERRSEESYQEEFLNLFRRAVKRRVTWSNNLICHLSGGMDSTAIVSIADLLSNEGELSEKVRTLSFYDPSEPNWDDHLYYGVVESLRGESGTHVSASLGDRSFESASTPYPLPGADRDTVTRELDFEQALGPGTVKAIVAGHGGDELLGGRSDPIPELGDLLCRLQWHSFLSSSFEWARFLRRPLITLVRDVGRSVWNLYPSSRRTSAPMPMWLHAVQRDGVKVPASRLWQLISLGLLPSELDKQDTWDNLTDTLPHLVHAHTVRYEYRFPFLDKELVEFLLQVPLNELRRPKRRRHMMRAAMKNVMPTAILERKRKAYVSRAPLVAIQNHSREIGALISKGVLVQANLIDPHSFLQTLSDIENGRGNLRWLAAINRAVELELWINQAATPMGCGRQLGVPRSVWPAFVQTMQKSETRGAL